MNRKVNPRLLFVALACIQLWVIYLTFSNPVGGISLQKLDHNNWIIDRFEPNSIASELGLKIGDQIIDVNRQDPNEYFSIIRWRTLDQAKTIGISRGGKDFEVSTAGIPTFSSIDVLSLVGETLSFFIALLLYKKVPNSQSARFLSLVFLNIGAIFMSLVASIRGDALGKVLIGVLVMLLPVILLNFLIIFLKEKGNLAVTSKYIKYLYRIVCASLLIEFTYFTSTSFTFFLNHVMTNFDLLFFILGLLLNLAFLSVVYWKHRKEKTYLSIIIKTVWISLLVSCAPVACFSFIPQLIFGNSWLYPIYMGWFILFFPLSFAYLIVTKRLYDIDVILRRILFTAIISLVPSTVMIGIIALLFPSETSVQRLVIAWILFVVIQTCILYSLENFTTRFERIMFPRKHQLQAALKKIAKNLGSISSFRDLKDIFLFDIVNSLHVFGGAIVFKYSDSIEMISEGEIDEYEAEQLVAAEQWEHPYFSVFEINRHEEFTSYLIMTQKKTRTLLGTEETQWLNLIMTYLSVSLENVHLIRKLTMKLQQLAAHIPNEQASGDFIWFRKLMFELQENERVRIATDLHDTTMQDLFFLKDRLQTLMERHTFDQGDEAQMVSIIDYIDIINANLRQSCFELHPYLLKEIGLVQTIEKLVRFERVISTFIIEFQVSRVSMLEQQDMNTKRHIFRMVQELLNNAKKHSQASRIGIKLTVVNHTIHLDYADDGVGFETSKSIASTEIGASGIGMEQMKSRILSLNGRFKLETSKGKGMRFSVTFPLKEGQTA